MLLFLLNGTTCSSTQSFSSFGIAWKCSRSDESRGCTLLHVVGKMQVAFDCLPVVHGDGACYTVNSCGCAPVHAGSWQPKNGHVKSNAKKLVTVAYLVYVGKQIGLIAPPYSQCRNCSAGSWSIQWESSLLWLGVDCLSIVGLEEYSCSSSTLVLICILHPPLVIPVTTLSPSLSSLSSLSPDPRLPFPGFLNRWGQIQTCAQLNFTKYAVNHGIITFDTVMPLYYLINQITFKFWKKKQTGKHL